MRSRVRRVGGLRVALWGGMLCLAALAPVLIPADNVTLSPSADTTLFESAPDDNMGGWYHVVAGTTGSQSQHSRNRGLFRFDVAAAIPSGATITNAILTLKVVRVPGNSGSGGPVNSIFGLHRVLKDWGEGVQLGDRGFPANPGEATWNCRFEPDQFWTQPGGRAPEDYVATSSATQMIAGLGAYQFGPTPLLIADVQSWLDHAATNFGWMLITQSESIGKTARGFGAREDPTNAAALWLRYTLPAPPKIDQLIITNQQVVVTVSGQPGQALVVEFKNDLQDPAWTTLTNLTFAPNATHSTVLDARAPQRRFYRARSL